MPAYDYECEECNKVREYVHSFKLSPEFLCEHCSGKMKRILSGRVGVEFRGSGFYANDYNGKKPSHIKKAKS